MEFLTMKVGKMMLMLNPAFKNHYLMRAVKAVTDLSARQKNENTT
jgi:hypothetical protein